MSRGLKEDILQLVREWHYSLVSGISDTDVLAPFDDDRPRRSKPFVLVQFLTHFEQLGHDEFRRRNNGGTIEGKVLGQRRDTVQIDGYGADSQSWLEDANLALRSFAGRAFQRNNNIAIQPTSSTREAAGILAGSYERRETRDYEIRYGVETSWVSISPEITQLDLTGLMRDHSDQPDADALSLSLSLTV